LELRFDPEAVRDGNHRRQTHLLAKFHRHCVDRARECLFKRDGARVRFGIVVGRPFLFVILDGDRLIDAHRRRCQSALEGGEIDKRLERGAGLSAGFGGAIERALGVIAAADQGSNRAIGREETRAAWLALAALAARRLITLAIC
jgi:hypothetical protein